MQKDDGMTEKYTTNLAEVAVSLGALQSSSMPITELNNPMTPLRDSDLPPTAACLLTSVSRECPEGEGIGLSMPEKPRMEGGDARGVDRGSFSNDLRLWILKKKKRSLWCPRGPGKVSPERDNHGKPNSPGMGAGKNAASPVAAV